MLPPMAADEAEVCKHKLAMAGLVVLALLYTLGIFSDFFATQIIEAEHQVYQRSSAADPFY